VRLTCVERVQIGGGSPSPLRVRRCGIEVDLVGRRLAIENPINESIDTFDTLQLKEINEQRARCEIRVLLSAHLIGPCCLYSYWRFIVKRLTAGFLPAGSVSE
jgi:hypothetical protein